ncbi:PRC-barrel domain containing protein [Streptosporangium algeriense]|uniref:PRC-barrel domain containing protein n=1 Tax=Streptosporangium algeriense TaxID=1682748 RepID=A0ABW3DP71_9ACTN
MTVESLWTYRAGVFEDENLSVIGFDVEATDGVIGTVDEESNVAGDSFVVVDVGFWSFGRRVVLPAAAVTRIDPHARKVHLALTKEEIEGAPEFAEDTYRAPVYRAGLDDYYGRLPAA